VKLVTETLAKLLSGNYVSGLYRISPLLTQQLLSLMPQQTDPKIFHLDGHPQQDFVEYWKIVFEMPDFTQNENGILDWLRDLSWFSCSGYLIVLTDYPANESVTTILNAATGFWATRMKNRPFMYCLFATPLDAVDIQRFEHEKDHCGYPVDAMLSHFEAELCDLAAQWRNVSRGLNRQAEVVREYHTIFTMMIQRGWRGRVDIECELPDELMPELYFKM
jgi:hypothetical protein